MRPEVIKWFRVYCWVLCVLYLAVAVFSLIALIFFLMDLSAIEMPRISTLNVVAAILLFGLGMLVASLLPLILKPRPWVWTYDLIIICLGMTSACFLPACIPLLIFWLKPETKSYFGKT